MRTSLLAIALLLAACGGAFPNAQQLTASLDGGADAGVADDDGGASADAGLPDDAGAPEDAGLPDAGAADAGVPDAGVTVQPRPTLSGCEIFPADSEWNRDISGDPVDAHSSDYVAFMGGASLVLQPDFGGPFGMPYLVVPAGQKRAPMSFLYANQSDPGPYPFPQDVPIQQATDHHVTVLTQDECKIYETYQTRPDGNGGFHASSGAVFDLTTGAPRPDGWTSADASGLPILPGMARYDEAGELGFILHALSFTVGGSAHSYVAPATHSSGTTTASFAPPMGLRVRLKANYDLSPYTGQTLVILKAMKRYGMFLTDNSSGRFWAVSGSLDSRWNSDNLEQIKSVPASAFEVVKLPELQPGN